MAHYLISEASRRLHVEAHVLRYWEEELNLEIPRNELGHRYYTEKQIALFQRIKELKELGYQLKAIRTSLQDEDKQEQTAEEAGFLLEKDRDEPQAVPFTVLSGQAEMRETQEGSRIHAEAGPESARAEGPRPEGQCMEGTRKETAAPEKQQTEGARPEADGQYGPEAEGGLTQAEAAGLALHTTAGGGLSASPEKLMQFQAIMTDVLAEALRRNQGELSREMGGKISEKVVKEMNCLIRDREEREEERYRKLDETIRACQRVQKQKSEAAATRVPARGAGRKSFGWRKKKK